MKLRRIFEKPNFVLVACQPKTASTFVTNALGNLPGSRTFRPTSGYDRREQELEEARFQRYRLRQTRNYVAQAHVRMSEPTKTLIKRYDIKTVVLYRDLLDFIVSVRDHVRRESVVWPMAYLDERHLAMPDEELDMAIARLMVPWNVNFYMSWRASGIGHFVNYDEIGADAEGTLSRIAKSVGISADTDHISGANKSALAQPSRFNKGKSGRGSTLSVDVKSAVRDIVKCYPGAEKDPYFAPLF